MHKLSLPAAAVLALASAAVQAGTVAKDNAQAAPRQASTEEMRALGEKHPVLTQREAARRSIQRMADGAEMIANDPSAAEYTVVTRQVDGGVRTDCVAGEVNARRLVAAGSKPAASRPAIRTEEARNDR